MSGNIKRIVLITVFASIALVFLLGILSLWKKAADTINQTVALSVQGIFRDEFGNILSESADSNSITLGINTVDDAFNIDDSDLVDDTFDSGDKVEEIENEDLGSDLETNDEDLSNQDENIDNNLNSDSYSDLSDDSELDLEAGQDQDLGEFSDDSSEDRLVDDATYIPIESNDSIGTIVDLVADSAGDTDVAPVRRKELDNVVAKSNYSNSEVNFDRVEVLANGTDKACADILVKENGRIVTNIKPTVFTEYKIIVSPVSQINQYWTVCFSSKFSGKNAVDFQVSGMKINTTELDFFAENNFERGGSVDNRSAMFVKLSSLSHINGKLVVAKKNDYFIKDKLTDADLIAFAGVADPFSTVKLYIHSDQEISKQTVAKADGSWSILLESPLVLGEHKAEVAFIDRNGNESPKKNISRFTVVRSYGSAIFIAFYILGLLALILGIYLFVKWRNKGGGSNITINHSDLPFSSSGMLAVLLLVSSILGWIIWQKQKLKEPPKAEAAEIEQSYGLLPYGGTMVADWRSFFAQNAIRVGHTGDDLDADGMTEEKWRTNFIKWARSLSLPSGESGRWTQIYIAGSADIQDFLRKAPLISQIRKEEPMVYELGLDDFLSKFSNAFRAGTVTAETMDKLIDDVKSASDLKFGITLYDDDLLTGSIAFFDMDDDPNGDQDSSTVNHLNPKFKAGVDVVHLYPHYRKFTSRMPEAIELAKQIFPNAKIFLGSYPIDRIDYIGCNYDPVLANRIPCTQQEEMDLFKQSFDTSTRLLREGEIDSLEFWPAYFGLEQQWPYYAEPGTGTESTNINFDGKYCKDRTRCLNNTAEIRQSVLSTLHKYLSKKITISSQTDIAQTGDEITFNVRFENDTQESFSDLSFNIPIPNEFDYVEGSATNSGLIADGNIVWQINSLAPGEIFNAEFKLIVK